MSVDQPRVPAEIPAGPLAVLQRIRGARPMPSRRRALRDVRRGDRHRALAHRQRRDALAHVRVPGLLPAVHVPRRRARVSRGAGALPVVPHAGDRRDGVGRAADPGRRRVLLPQLPARSHDRVLPEPGRRDRVGAAARRMGGARRPATPSSPRCCRTSRRCWSDATIRTLGGRRRGRVLPRPDRRLLPARRARSGRSGVGSTAGATPETPSTRSSPRSGGAAGRPSRPLPTAGSRHEPARRSRCSTSRRSSTPWRRNLLVKLRIAETTGQAIHAIALRCQVRIEPQRRTYSGEERSDLRRAVRAARAVGALAHAVPVDPHVAHRRGFTDQIEVDLPVTARTTSRWRPRSTSTRCRRRGAVGVPVQRDGVLPDRDRLRRRAGAVGPRTRRTGCRCRCGAIS